MHRRFIALVIGTALAVTGLAAAPVKAQSRGESAAIITGVAGLAIVGAALADDRKQDRRKDHVARNYRATPEYYAPKRHHEARKYHKSSQRHDHRGQRCDDRRSPSYTDYDRSYRYDDRGYRRGDGK